MLKISIECQCTACGLLNSCSTTSLEKVVSCFNCGEFLGKIKVEKLFQDC